MLPCFKHNQINSAKANPIRTRLQGLCNRLLCNRLLCFKHNQIKSTKAHPIRTRSQGGCNRLPCFKHNQKKCKGAPDTNPITGFFFIMWEISLVIFPESRQKPLAKQHAWGGAPCAHRNLRLRAAHFSPLFQHHTISSPVSCRKTLFVTAFLKKDKSICFPFRCLSKIVEKFLFLIPYYPLHFLLVCLRIVLQNLYE